MKEGQKQHARDAAYKYVNTQLDAELYTKYFMMVLKSGSDLKTYTAHVIADHVNKNWKSFKDKL